MSKIAWLDLETSGLKAYENAILQIALLIEEDGKVKDKFVSYVAPLPDDIIDNGALEVNGLDREQIKTFPDPKIVIKQLVNFLNLHVNKFDTTDKLAMAGYNVVFDDKFLRAWFKKLNEKYYGSYFYWRRICVLDHSIHYMVLKNMILPRGFKLAAAIEMFDVKMGKAHDAEADIIATRNVYHQINKRLFGDAYIFEEYPKTVLHDATQSPTTVKTQAESILERLRK
ncbi:hypothetical protein LCGC14_0602280 [marine sediment metagenome]|uniref:Exonuclease domain-containing protein n=1 Tax=marine sediment metagenome TaxID=412755 RepID=A0A0F9REY2_9ZZZZ